MLELRIAYLISFILVAALAASGCGRSRRKAIYLPAKVDGIPLTVILSGIKAEDAERSWMQYFIKCDDAPIEGHKVPATDGTVALKLSGPKLTEGRSCRVDVMGTAPAELAATMQTKDGVYYTSSPGKILDARLNLDMTAMYGPSAAPPATTLPEVPAGPIVEETDAEAVSIAANSEGLCQDFDVEIYECVK